MVKKAYTADLKSADASHTGSNPVSGTNPTLASGTKFYRYDVCNLTDNRMDIYCSEYEVRRKTPCGTWIYSWHTSKKFVLDNSKKKFACETKELALQSFIARRKRYQRILKARLCDADYSIELAEELLAKLKA